jgi:hypothetical protein
MVSLPPSVEDSLPPDVTSDVVMSLGEPEGSDVPDDCDLPPPMDSDNEFDPSALDDVMSDVDDDNPGNELHMHDIGSTYVPTPEVAINLRGRHDFAELYSPPRCLARGAEFNLHGNLSLDILSGWDFRRPDVCALALRVIHTLKVTFVILSPPCTIFSELQRLWNFKKMTKESVAFKWAEGMTYLSHSMACAELQHRHGRFFLFEHPATASSWKTPEVQKVVNLPGVFSVVIDQCMVGLKTKVTNTSVRKRTRLLTNAPSVAARFAGCRCNRQHDHQPIRGSEGGMRRSTFAQIYPPGLVEKLCCVARDLSA